MGNVPVIDRLMLAKDDDEENLPTTEIMSDSRIRIFICLYNRKDKWVSFQKIAETVVDENEKIRNLMNKMYQYGLAEHDYRTKTYKYKDTKEAKNLISKLKKRSVI
jgi:predicted transcriptional regulator